MTKIRKKSSKLKKNLGISVKYCIYSWRYCWRPCCEAVFVTVFHEYRYCLGDKRSFSCLEYKILLFKVTLFRFKTFLNISMKLAILLL